MRGGGVGLLAGPAERGPGPPHQGVGEVGGLDRVRGRPQRVVAQHLDGRQLGQVHRDDGLGRGHVLEHLPGGDVPPAGQPQQERVEIAVHLRQRGLLDRAVVADADALVGGDPRQQGLALVREEAEVPVEVEPGVAHLRVLPGQAPRVEQRLDRHRLGDRADVAEAHGGRRGSAGLRLAEDLRLPPVRHHRHPVRGVRVPVGVPAAHAAVDEHHLRGRAQHAVLPRPRAVAVGVADLLAELVEGPGVPVVQDVGDPQRAVQHPRGGEGGERVPGGDHDVVRVAGVLGQRVPQHRRDPARVRLREGQVPALAAQRRVERGEGAPEPAEAPDVGLPVGVSHARPHHPQARVEGRLETRVDRVDVVLEELARGRVHRDVPARLGQVVGRGPCAEDTRAAARGEEEREVEHAGPAGHRGSPYPRGTRRS